jgi:bifunctional non-homologous end joining protein LigD
MRSGLPDLISPMLAAAGPLPTGADWAYEYKFDGVRAVSYVDRHVRVLSRNDRDISGAFPELGELVPLLDGRPAVVDGEIVALEPGQRPSFSRLQRRMHVVAPSPALLRTVPVAYYVFDVLYLDEESTLELPYEQRRARLTSLGLDGDSVRVPANFTGVDGAAVLKAAELAGLEGVVGKRLGSRYRPGQRSTDWTKTPLIRTQEALILGYTAGEGRRAGTIGALMLGVYDDTDTPIYVGNVGTGFTDAALRQLQEQLAPLRRNTSPVPGIPRQHARNAQWVEPVLVGEVAYRTWTTPDGRLRHPSWRGLRPDRSGPVPRAPQPVPLPPSAQVEGAMQTPDGRWRVEIASQGGTRWYRVVHGDNIVDGLGLAGVKRILAEDNVDMRLLSEVVPAA